MLSRMLQVRRSTIHGKGLFARRDIPEGSVLGRCRVGRSRRQTPYTLWLDEHRGSVEVRCRFRFINHAKAPNVAYYDDLTVVALRRICAGEELLHDYGDEWV